MKIAFLNSSLEPGRDGVGDYTRLLAQECIRQGHSCCLIALNDHWLAEPGSGAENGMDVLRLPAALNWTDRTRLAREMLDNFGPDWISLQFVPYAFHPKGIVLGLASHLKPLTAFAKFHLMFHELWIGSEPGWPVKERVIGKIQRAYILNLHRALKPQVTHTSNAAYLARLWRRNIHARKLPLFSNISVQSRNGEDWIFPILRQHGVNIASNNRQNYCLLGIFGSLHPAWPHEMLFTALRAAQEQGQRIIFLSIGNLGGGEGLWQRLTLDYPSNTLIKLGMQSPERVSEYLNTLDAGIATVPYNLIEKSGSVVAMIEHGLPVIVSHNNGLNPFKTGMRSDNSCLREAAELSCVNFAKGAQRYPGYPRLPGVAQQFLSELKDDNQERETGENESIFNEKMVPRLPHSFFAA